jgi:V/A-type H+-transporting ATPase subunit F
VKLIGLCDQDTAIALRLGGIHEVYVPKDNLISLWNSITERNDVGIVFITEQLVEDLGNHLSDYRIRNTFPLIIELPDKKGRKKDHVDYISHLIKKAVGVEVHKEH